MLFMLDFRVEYPAGMSQDELFAIWAEEAEVALSAKETGAIVDLWKCVGTRRVMALLNVESGDLLDQVLMDLPIVKKMGQHVSVEVIPVRRYEDFAEDLKQRIA